MPVPVRKNACAEEEGEALRCFLSIKNTFPQRVAEDAATEATRREQQDRRMAEEQERLRSQMNKVMEKLGLGYVFANQTIPYSTTYRKVSYT